MNADSIRIKNAHQNNLKNLDLELPTNELIVVTGVSGSGKSTLAFDTIYAEGQRRYVETFSAYARQFLDRMDKPAVDSIDGIPPAIAIDQTNPVRTSRSTVGTMTELNDYLKLLFARMARLFCPGCGREVVTESAQSIVNTVYQQAQSEQAVMITFPVRVPENFTNSEIIRLLEQQGYTRIHRQRRQGKNSTVEVVQDRLKLRSNNRERLNEAVEVALQHGNGHVRIYPLDQNREAHSAWVFSRCHHCPDCDIDYDKPSPGTFSFNSAVGACESCRGFGRIIGVDFSLVIPDDKKTLAEGAVKSFQTQSYNECQRELMHFARKRDIPTDKPWKKLSKKQQRWVLEGEGEWEDGVWYGVQRFFTWLESKAYKMHIRVLLSKYRAYTECEHCHGARLKPAALWWRLGGKKEVDTLIDSKDRFVPMGINMADAVWRQLPGLTIHDVMRLPLVQCRDFFYQLQLPEPFDEASEILLGEIRTRLSYLVEVGLGYLTLDRQSRTLSGGEVQRINLTTALGTSLVNTLFVLDEPSIGLHARDITRLIKVLHRLRDAGNSLLVVEHDAQVMLSADRILDMGPGPGKQGGEVCFYGKPAALLKHKRSLTADYLSGRKQVSEGGEANPPDAKTRYLKITGARENNLKNLDVEIPLQRLVCVCGVSGSGKSTLVRDVLYQALRKKMGKPLEAPGLYRKLTGDHVIADVVLVDQSPIGKTTRSIPATYVGAFDAIRKLFVNEPLAKQRQYTPGTFSFNSGKGRCPTCQGNGFEHVEMQFLSDVYLRCTDCDGKRFREEVLDIKLLGRRVSTSSAESKQACSIADVLQMTVAEALDFFVDYVEVVKVLQPLVNVGLHYVQLGQAVPTLSGGEAQRLKLAGHLAKTVKKKPTSQHKGLLFLFDEPTTGLHADDIATLMRAFQQLIGAGHSLLVIEHNLDVLAAADWLIEIGPEGGEGGGELVFQGTPQQIVQDKCSHTGRALSDYQMAANHVVQASPGQEQSKTKKDNAITIHHAREHNLKNIDLRIPRDQFTVISGISGSGKSTVAFDIVFGEGQRRYLESLNAYARQFVQPATRPDVDAIYGIPPTVAIEQRTSRGGRKSTVATLTEIYHFLRLLFVKLGVQHCPDCKVAIEAQSEELIRARLAKNYRGKKITLLAPLIVSRKGIYKDLAKWADKQGYEQLRVDGDYLPTADWPVLDRYKEHSIELPVGQVKVAPSNEALLSQLLQQSLALGNGVVIVATDSGRRGSTADTLFSTQRACPSCGRGFDELDPRLFSFNSRHGWCERCYGTGVEISDFDEEQTGEEQTWLEPAEEGVDVACKQCSGERLNPVALAVTVKAMSIAALSAQTVAQSTKTFAQLRLNKKQQLIARDIVSELQGRLHFLQKVGLDYLTLDRAAPSLSGGEAQRIRLAAQLGSKLQGVCYILDEPTIGLHTRDNRRLIEILRELQQQGNTVLVVEHDEDTIREADHLIDMGPAAGVNGGEVVATGSLKQLCRNPRSVTGRFMKQPLVHPLPDLRDDDRRQQYEQETLCIVEAKKNNLRNLQLSIPLRKLVCISGVSGSGKSTLVRSVLYDNLHGRLQTKTKTKTQSPWRGCERIEGWQSLQRILEVDQTPIGKTPRSCPATYIGIWDTIRKLFADTVDARLRGYGPGRFSFNVAGGRCDACGGHGMRKVEMSFLPDVRVNCEVCHGWRFNEETLAIRYKGKHIAEVLMMDVDEAESFFAALPTVHQALRLLQQVGLGYLTLGQQSPTLSGGEAQRIKLVAELAKVRPHLHQHNLYVLDEPTVGLHMADVEKLIRVLHQLVDAGNSVLVIEHNLDVIAASDWLIDMGPEGGNKGGRIIAQGEPIRLAQRNTKSHTVSYLADFLKQRRAV